MAAFLSGWKAVGLPEIAPACNLPSHPTLAAFGVASLLSAVSSESLNATIVAGAGIVAAR